MIRERNRERIRSPRLAGRLGPGRAEALLDPFATGALAEGPAARRLFQPVPFPR